MLSFYETKQCIQYHPYETTKSTLHNVEHRKSQTTGIEIPKTNTSKEIGYLHVSTPASSYCQSINSNMI